VVYTRLVLLTALVCFLFTCGDELNAGETTVDPAYAACLQAEITELPGVPKLAIDGSDLGAFNPPGAPGIARSEVVDVEGQPFAKVLRVHVLKPVRPVYRAQLVTPKSRIPVQKGDVLLAVYHTRCLESTAETGGGHTAGYLQLTREPWTTEGNLYAFPGKEWQKRYARFTSTQDYPPGSLQIAFHLGRYEQVIDFAGVALLNFGPDVDITELPVSTISYVGREADAPWRKEARDRIEKYRKGDLRVEVRDVDGAPVAGATVRAEMARHAYQFGTFLEQPALQQTPDGERYRETVERLFNRVTCPWYWADWGWPSQQDTYLGISQWAHDHGFHMRSHNLIWPSWRWTPSDLKKLEGDPDALREAVHDSISRRVEMGRTFGFDDYDVINELRVHHTIVDILGKPVIVDWFKLAKSLDPGAKMGINDYSIVGGGGHTEEQQDIYEGQIRYLLDQGAPLELIGLQCHFGEDFTPPAQVVRILDRFAAFGLPLHATEFDISTDDEVAQGDYMRDFLTVFFSHPATESITQWGFWQGHHWIPRAALFREDWSVKPNGQAYMDLVLGEWWTHEAGKTNAQGVFTVRGFLGDYEIAVEAPGVAKTVKGHLTRDGLTVKVAPASVMTY